ncbi:alanine racemase [Oricola indica]|uniref:alanine racemase n=1 Tax=Oricola indica TaxID=2872591 RepID=UPI003CCC2BD2
MARVLQVREVNEGIAVGYGHRYWATRDRQLAVISIGYADGWMRHVDLGAMHRGKRLPLAGRVSMDSITVDASGIPPDRLREGGWVDLIDARQTVDEVAAAAGTIGYEILCGLGQRIAREYVHPHGN